MQSKSTSNILGIDISHHQNSIDWSKVAASGVKFAFVKATEGLSVVDSYLKTNVQNAKANKIYVGLYHYARAEKNGALSEATFFVNTTKGLNPEFPYVLDLEGACSSLGKAKATQWALTFMDTVAKLTGKQVMIYTGGSFARSYCDTALAKYPLWVAHYGVNTPMSNSTWSQWSVFQYTSSGSVKGIAGNVDMNLMERAFFDKLIKPTTSPKPIPVATEVDKIKVVINDVLVDYGRILDDGHTYLPLRKVGDAIDKTVEWDNDKKLAYVDGQLVKNIRLIDNVCFAQIREAAELFGGLVSFNNGTKKVYIYN